MEQVYVVGNTHTEGDKRQLQAAIDALRKLGYVAGKLDYDEYCWGLPPDGEIYFIVLVTQDILLDRDLVWMLGNLINIESQLYYVGARPLKLEPFIRWQANSTWTPWLPKEPVKVIQAEPAKVKNTIKDSDKKETSPFSFENTETITFEKYLEQEMARAFRDLLRSCK